MSKITQGEFKVLSNKKVGPGYLKMAIRAPGIVRQARPGQFVHLRCTDSTEPLLRRPFSLHRLNQNNFEILYKLIGRGTNLLSKKQKGDIINILGPLGNGFDIKKPEAILISGGMGVAPLLALAEKLTRAQRKKSVLVLLGAKTKNSVLCERDFRKLGCAVQIATDDGSKGYKGFVTKLLKEILQLARSQKRPATIYACGPNPMLKEIAQMSRRLRISSQGSLEENVACGVGVCLGCAIMTQDGYKRVCKDGPVFNLQEIKW